MVEGVTHDAFLGGRLVLAQPRKGYRAGVDPVLLAASLPAVAGQRVLDLGCGVGAAGLCLAARVPGVQVWGLEVQAEYAALARENAAAMGGAMQVVSGDLAAMPAALREMQFDHVIANPPYFLRGASVGAPDAGRERAMGEATPLADWVRVAAKRVAQGGYVTFIQRAERLPELMGLMQAHLGSLQLLPLIPRVGREAQLVLLRGRKGGRADFRLFAGLEMHQGAVHEGDFEDYSPLMREILRNGAALPFPA
ncbi:MAG: tRNA1(Val) (adenine(37)-N6)-methyltransferase [Thalassovita sp.]